MTVPWMSKPLDEWSIVGMNHYHVGGERRLFVAMTKGGRCIVEEGKDDEYLWNRLWRKAAGEPESPARPTLPAPFLCCRACGCPLGPGECFSPSPGSPTTWLCETCFHTAEGLRP